MTTGSSATSSSYWSQLTAKSLPMAWQPPEATAGAAVTSATALGALPTTTTTTTSSAWPQSWNRNPSALQAAGQALLMDDRNNVPAFWSWRNGSAAQSGTATTATPAGTSTPSTATTTASSTGAVLPRMEDRVRQHEQSILDRLLRETEDQLREQLELQTQSALEQSYQRHLNSWMQERVGRQTLGGSSGSNSRASSTNGSAKQQPLALLAGPSNAPPTNAPVASTLTPRRIQGHGQLLTDLPRWLPHQAAHNFANLTEQDMASCATGNAPPALAMALAGYLAAWQWLEAVLQHSESHNSGGQSQSTSQSPDPVQHACATLFHLCQVFRRQVQAHVAQAQTSINGNRNAFSSSAHQWTHEVARECQAYADLVLPPNSLENTWAVLYFCMRCGSPAAAEHVWQSLANMDATTTMSAESQVKSLFEDVSQLLADAIDALLQAWQKQVSYATGANSLLHLCWDAPVPPRLSVSQQRVVADFLQAQNTTAAGTNTSGSPYKAGFLVLLSGMGSLPNESNLTGFSTIEDYLVGHVWNAVLDQQSSPVEALANVGAKHVVAYGSSYFGHGWSYALPLLWTQQYQRALRHLVEAIPCAPNAENGGIPSDEGLLQATHLAIVMSSLGKIPLDDLIASGTQSAQTGKIASMEEDLAYSLLVAYGNRLLADTTAGPLAALEYLVLIPNLERRRKEVANLIVKTGDLARLVGTVDSEGRRQPLSADQPSLDRKFSSQEVSVILRQAGDQLLQQRRSADIQKLGTAALCYLLAGQYDSVLVLLTDMLCPPDDQSPDKQNERAFWISQTESFHEYYLIKRTHVLNMLEKQNQLGLIATSRLVLDLNYFFQSLAAGKYAEAYSLAIHRIKLLPLELGQTGTHGNSMGMNNNSHEWAADKETAFRNLDERVQKTFLPFLLGVMQTLYQEHVQLKSMHRRSQAGIGPAAADSVTAARLQQLQHQAQRLVTFAGILHVPQDDPAVMNKLSEMEARMI